MGADHTRRLIQHNKSSVSQHPHTTSTLFGNATTMCLILYEHDGSGSPNFVYKTVYGNVTHLIEESTFDRVEIGSALSKFVWSHVTSLEVGDTYFILFNYTTCNYN